MNGHPPPASPPTASLPTTEVVTGMLASAGLTPECWGFRLRLTQEAYRDWLKIPVMTDRLLRRLEPDERARRMDEAFLSVDAGSWRWECWTGWTAWAPQ